MLVGLFFPIVEGNNRRFQYLKLIMDELLFAITSRNTSTVVGRSRIQYKDTSKPLIYTTTYIVIQLQVKKSAAVKLLSDVLSQSTKARVCIIKCPTCKL